MLGKVVRHLFRAAYVLALLIALVVAADTVVRVFAGEGFAGLWHPVTLHKIGEGTLLLWALLGLRGPVERELRSARLSVMLSMVLGGIAWWQLSGRAPWAWWCLVLVAVGLCRVLPSLPSRTRRTKVLRVVAVLLLGSGYLSAIALNYTLGTGRAFYPVLPALPDAAADRDERWRQDLDYAFEGLRTLHVNAFHTTPEADLRAAFDAVSSRVATRSDTALAVDLARLVARVGDAHTSLTPVQSRRALRFPIDVRWFGEELRVVHTASGAHRFLGTRVRAVAATPVARLRSMLREISSHEYVEWADRSGARMACYAEVLQALGVLREPSRCTFEFVFDNGQNVHTVLRSRPFDEIAFTQSARKARAAFEDRSTPYAYGKLDDGAAFYFRYGRCEQSMGVGALAGELFAELDAAPDARLVIDLRHNTGGSTLPFSWLVMPELEARRARFDQPDRLFVLIDSVTYSSGAGVADVLRQTTKATFVGQPTGGHTGGFGEVRSFRLPNSGLVLSYSTRGPGPGDPKPRRTLPDVPIARTFAQWAEGTDPVLDHARGR